MLNRKWNSLGILLFVLFVSSLAQASDLTFGVYTTEKPSTIFSQYKPLLEYIEGDLKKNQSDGKITLKIIDSYENALRMLVEGQIDFSSFGPASYVLAKERNKQLQLLATESEQGKKEFLGIFITRADTGIRSIEDLKRKRYSFAFGDPNSTIGRYLSQAELVRHGLHADSFSTIKYLDRHDKVASAVAIKEFDAGVVRAKTFDEYREKGLMSFGEFKNHTRVWVASSSLPKEKVEALRKVLLQVPAKDPVLKPLKIDGFLPTSEAEFQETAKGMHQARAFEAKPR